MATLNQLRHESQAAWDKAEGAWTAYRKVARRQLVGELQVILGRKPEATAVTLSSSYEYDDEGGYPRFLSGEYEGAGDDIYDYWTEGLDIEQRVILELFDIEDCGEGRLTREQVAALAIAEGVEI